MFSLHFGGLEVTVCIRDLHFFFICELVDNAMLVTAVSPLCFWYSMKNGCQKDAMWVDAKRFLAGEAIHFLGFVVFKKFVASYLVKLYI